MSMQRITPIEAFVLRQNGNAIAGTIVGRPGEPT